MIKTITDCQGTRMVVGDSVVYNKSGELTTGTIQAIKISWKEVTWISVPKYRFTGFIEIQQHGTEHISRIRNPNSIFVLS